MPDLIDANDDGEIDHVMKDQAHTEGNFFDTLKPCIGQKRSHKNTLF